MTSTTKTNSQPKYLKTPSDWLHHHITIELKKQLPESKDLSILISNIISSGITITKKHAGEGTELRKILAEKKDIRLSRSEPLSRPSKADLETKKEEEYKKLSEAFEAQKFQTYVRFLEDTYKNTDDLKLRELLAPTLLEIYHRHANLLSPDHEQIVMLQDPIKFLKRRVKQIAEIYTTMHKRIGGDHKEITDELPNELKKVLDKAIEEFKLPERKQDATLEDFIKSTNFAKRETPLVRAMNLYPANMIDDLLESKRSVKDVPDGFIAAYHMGIMLHQFEPPDPKDRERMAVHEQIMLRVQHMREQYKQIDRHLNMAILNRFVIFLEEKFKEKFTSIIERKSQNKTAGGKETFVLQTKAFFEKLKTKKIKTPQDYIAYLNRKTSGHHLHRMIVVTLDQIYRCYGDLLPRGHQKLPIQGIQSLPVYEFESPTEKPKKKSKTLKR